MKKLIALVLFVAMMAMMVPTAAAMVTGGTGDNDANQVRVALDKWYGSQTAERLKTNTSGTTEAGQQAWGTTIDKCYVGGYGAWDGLKVKVTYNKSDNVINVTLTGAWDKIEPQSIDGGVTYARAIRIPIVMTDENGITLDVSEHTISNGSGMSLVREYGENGMSWLYMVLQKGGNTASAALSKRGDYKKVTVNVTYKDESYSADKQYTNVTFDVVSIAGKQKDNFRVTVEDAKNGPGDDYNVEKSVGLDPTKSTVTYDNEGTIKFQNGEVVTQDLGTLAGQSTANDIWGGTSDWAYSEDGIYAVNKLTFSIAALDPASRAQILNASSYTKSVKYTTTKETTDVFGNKIPKGKEVSETRYFFNAADDSMIVRLKAYRPDGTVYPAGTMVELTNVAYEDKEDLANNLWDTLLGTSNKTVSSAGKPAYYVDSDGTFVLSIPGISAFAASAAGLNPDVTYKAPAITPQNGSSAVYNLYNIMQAYTNFINGKYGISKSDYEDVVNWTAGNANFTWAYKWYIGRLGLAFTYGAKQDVAALDIYFQNTPKTSSGISTLGSDYTIDLGTTAQIPYIYDDANAMQKELKSGWASVNTKIATVSGDRVTAKAVGTTYLFCTDINGNVHIITLTVVDPNEAPVVTPAVTGPTYTQYVVTASKLNVRAGQSASSARVGSYARNTVVYGIENPATGWVAIYANGELVGYCSGAYLAEIE